MKNTEEIKNVLIEEPNQGVGKYLGWTVTYEVRGIKRSCMLISYNHSSDSYMAADSYNGIGKLTREFSTSELERGVFEDLAHESTNYFDNIKKWKTITLKKTKIHGAHEDVTDDVSDIKDIGIKLKVVDYTIKPSAQDGTSKTENGFWVLMMKTKVDHARIISDKDIWATDHFAEKFKLFAADPIISLTWSKLNETKRKLRDLFDTAANKHPIYREFGGRTATRRNLIVPKDNLFECYLQD